MVWYMLMFTNLKRAPEHAWGIMVSPAPSCRREAF